MGGIAESAREREAFRYDPTLIEGTVVNESPIPRPSSDLVTSPDTSLTAYCQLAAVRLDVQRTLISLFDVKYQHVIAEATRTSPLTANAKHDAEDGGLWLCGTAIPRSFGICEHVIDLVPHKRWPRERVFVEEDLPVSVVPDVLENRRFNKKPYCQSEFYAGVPIRTPKGIAIGVFCVFDNKKRDGLDPAHVKIMRDLSETIMAHLEAKRSKTAYIRSQRMIRGIGSFFESKASVSGCQTSPNGSVSGAPPARSQQAGQACELPSPGGAEPATPDAEMIIKLLSLPVQMPPEGPSDNDVETSSRSAATVDAPRATASRESAISTVTSIAAADPDSADDQVNKIFSKGASILREALEVFGVVFVDASVHTFGGLHTRDSSASEEDVREQEQIRLKAEDSDCTVLGFSTTEVSSVESPFRLSVPEKLLAKLLKRHPEGKIFNFDEKGSRQSTDSSGDEDIVRVVTQTTISSIREESAHQNAQRLAGENESQAIINIFPGARSVALVPVWDARRQRWFAGGLAYTMSPTRVFSAEGELSYLKALGTVIMAEVSRTEIIIADKAKSNVLSSVSHELRSPLHGLLLGAELLSHSNLDVFQGNMLHAVETCGRTLLDTIDHLLDYSKINNFMAISSKRKGGARGLRPNRTGTIEAGMSSLSADVHLDVVAEEVVESLYFGHNYQRMSLAQMEKEMPSEHEDLQAIRRLDSMQTVEAISREGKRVSIGHAAGDNVSIYLDIDPEDSWMFHTQPGAVRRILMNLVGNSLKYTTKGSIQVCLRQDALVGENQEILRNVRISVADTGKGISQDYLRNQLFRPFAQEDYLAPGTGLGLSLVKQITTSLGGTIKVESRLGVGTIVQICIPMLPVSSISAGHDKTAEPDFADHVRQLDGLRVRLYGFGEDSDAKVDDLKLMETVCQGWLRMRAITNLNWREFAPDILLCTEARLTRLLKESERTKLPPIVTICQSVLAARKLSTSFAAENMGRGVFEFVSQPAGPRKLAKILLLGFNHWVEIQEALDSPDEQAGLSGLMWADPNSTLPGVASHADLKNGHPEEAPDMQLPQGNGLSKSSDPSPSSIPPTFTLRSLGPDPLNAARPELPRRISHEKPRTPSSLRSLSPASNQVLLVDDNPVNLKMLAAYMKKLGWAYTATTNGREALDTYAARPSGAFRYVFMDISMPVMDGFEASRLIRAVERERSSEKDREHFQPAVIIALTGLASADAQQEAFASGINLFLTKPVRLKELTQILRQQQGQAAAAAT